jgi:pimeloyl-ACP methyl ester carboxylesterase
MQIEVNGTRLWFDAEGPALAPEGRTMRVRPTLVLIHGGPGSFDHSYFKPHFAPLAEHAQVVYLDLRGHGRSGREDPAEWSFERCADDLRAFCEALAIVRPVVLGHSMGGFVAMLYGARHPDHAGALVLQSTTARHDLERLVEGFRRVAGDEVAETARRVYGAGPKVTEQEWERCFTAFGPLVPDDDELARTAQNRELGPPGMDLLRALDIVDELRHIHCPTLVCVGELDPVTPVGASREIVEALPPGVGRLEVVRGAGHFPWLDAPAAYREIVESFVRSAYGS